MTEPLHVAYRPHKFNEVIGHAGVIASLKSLIDNDDTHAFLFHGPSGVGKTTLARIVASELNCLPKDLLEIDAATNTGIDRMREVQEVLQYLPFGSGQIRAVIVDEAHGLSRQAWDSLLKVIEEPPAHIYWMLCTTQPDKVPPTIRSRCSPFALKSLKDDELELLLKQVCQREKIQLRNGITDLVIREAHGSPRQLLVNLALVRDHTDRAKAAAVLQALTDSDATRQLCRFLIEGRGSWQKAMGIVSHLEDVPAETVRIAVCNYFAVVAKGAKTEREAITALQILEAFSQYYNPAEQQAPLLRSIGQVLFQ